MAENTIKTIPKDLEAIIKAPHRYLENPPPLSPEAQKLLVEYSGIPPDQVEAHIRKIRDEAFAIHPYPCLGTFLFLSLSLPSLPSYPSLLTTLRVPGTNFLDLGTCLGQELRLLASEGVPLSNLHGAELQPAFVQIGYDLFRDGAKFGTEGGGTMLSPADIFDESDEAPLKGLEGKMDVIHAGSFFHLFDYAGNVAVAKRVVQLLRPVKGSVLVGRQVGNVWAGAYLNELKGGSRFRHDAVTWGKMWEEVGRETVSEWRVEAEMEMGPEKEWEEKEGKKEWGGEERRMGGKMESEGRRKLTFCVTRV